MATQPLAWRSRVGVARGDDVVFATALSLIVLAGLVYVEYQRRP
jgi:hypothetical protein